MSLRRIACEAAWLAAAWWLVGGNLPSAVAQFGVFGDAPASTAPASVETLSSNTQRRLQQVETLLAGEAWEEAVDVLAELIAEPSTELVGLPGEVFVPLRTYCQMQVAQLPPQALALYRCRVDNIAEGWLQRGVAERDEELLRRIVAELFCSSSGDEALLALGELALERGEAGAARRYWEAIHPGLRGPAGQPIELLIRDVDLATQGGAVRDYLTGAPQPKTWLAYPDSELALSDILAKLTVASIRERNFGRAERELALLRIVDRQATGRLAGSEVELHPALSEMLASARTWPTPAPPKGWPTFAGNATRSRPAAPLGRLAGPLWETPLITSQPTFAARQSILILNGRTVRVGQPPAATAAVSTCHPLVHGGAILFRDGDKIRAVALDTGQPAITRNGMLHEAGEQQAGADQPEALAQRLEVFGGGVNRGGRVSSRPQAMTVDGDTLLAVAAAEDDARDGRRPTPRESNRVIGLDLRRDGLLSVELQPPDASWSFSGPPICAAGRMYVPMRRDEIQPQLYVGCFSVATGRQLWRTAVCSSQSLSEFGGAQQPSDLLTLGGGAIFFNTNVGVVAALEQHNGSVRWLRRYPRGGTGSDNNRAITIARRETPCLYHRSAVVVAPADAAALFALDPNTGARLWATNEAYDVEHLLAAVEGTLVASGRRLWMLDVATGAVRQRWPDSIAAGIRGAGRGCVAGNEVFWPTEDAIYVFDVTTLSQSRLPINLNSLGLRGVNLVAAEGCLLLAGQDKLVALGATSRPSATEPQLSQLPTLFRPGLLMSRQNARLKWLSAIGQKTRRTPSGR